MRYFGQVEYERREKCRYCGKVCFRKKDAQTKRNSMLKSGVKDYLRIYQCHGNWHLTTEAR
jgi:hypothetical protein